MSLKLKRGPKDLLWQRVTVLHRDDHDRTYEDRFEIQIRLQAREEDDVREREHLIAAQRDLQLALAELRQSTASGISESAYHDLQARIETASQEAMRANRAYLQDKVANWRGLISADDTEIPFTPDNFRDVLDLTAYQLAIADTVRRARERPEAAGRKN